MLAGNTEDVRDVSISTSHSTRGRPGKMPEHNGEALAHCEQAGRTEIMTLSAFQLTDTQVHDDSMFLEVIIKNKKLIQSTCTTANCNVFSLKPFPAKLKGADQSDYSETQPINCGLHCKNTKC